MSNTKLLTAAEEIKDILRKYDIAGAVALHTTPGDGEYFVHLNTSYSCAFFVEDDEVRIRAKVEDFASKEECYLKQQNTSNMLKILADTTAINFSILSELSNTIDKATGAEHSEPIIGPTKL